jgi:hypothetical protein
MSEKTGMAGELQAYATWRTQDTCCPDGLCDRFYGLRHPITRGALAQEPKLLYGSEILMDLSDAFERWLGKSAGKGKGNYGN